MTFLGVDAGASHVEAGISGDGKTVSLRRNRTPVPSILADPVGLAREISSMAAELVAVTGAAPTHLVAGAAGAGDARVAREFAHTLQGLMPATMVTVTTDIEVAVAGSFSTECGIVVASGTGSYAALRREDGSFVRVGGWGPVIGDRGSAYDLARAALQHCAWWHDSGSEPSEFLRAITAATGVDDPSLLSRWSATAERHTIAGLARTVTELAATHDEVAEGLVARSAGHLLDLVTLLGQRSDAESLPVAMTGGLLCSGSAVRDALAAMLSDSGFHPTDQKVDGVLGAVRLAAVLESRT